MKIENEEEVELEAEDPQDQSKREFDECYQNENEMRGKFCCEGKDCGCEGMTVYEHIRDVFVPSAIGLGHVALEKKISEWIGKQSMGYYVPRGAEGLDLHKVLPDRLAAMGYNDALSDIKDFLKTL